MTKDKIKVTTSVMDGLLHENLTPGPSKLKKIVDPGHPSSVDRFSENVD